MFIEFVIRVGINKNASLEELNLFFIGELFGEYHSRC